MSNNYKDRIKLFLAGIAIGLLALYGFQYGFSGLFNQICTVMCALISLLCLIEGLTTRPAR